MSHPLRSSSPCSYPIAVSSNYYLFECQYSSSRPAFWCSGYAPTAFVSFLLGEMPKFSGMLHALSNRDKVGLIDAYLLPEAGREGLLTNQDYDLVVIGSGPAGQKGAIDVAKLGNVSGNWPAWVGGTSVYSGMALFQVRPCGTPFSISQASMKGVLRARLSST
jgi:hypothetical protein